ncbi:MAG: single-stranded-DNA-specific exonuclease RecJ [Victivallales bacterium]|nr:single-stranded-DNA-specific exonuclease RecJ [Victivallales bacterium]MCF7888896.1 single-stranded-DNA-specific exonuclease RecJ [Victivallales bacterium]
METQWLKKQYSGSDLSELIKYHGFSRPIAVALAARGINKENVNTYFNASLKKLSSPFRIPGMKKAAKRLWEALKRDENILIHGDFDVDGITASVLLATILSENGAKVSVFIPQRFDTGYGFSPESLERTLEDYEYSLLVTVDCGITSVEAVKKANSLGVDVIITDHHEQGVLLPEAHAIVNPKVHKGISDLSCLAGVGVAFKTAHAFIKYGLDNGLIFNRPDLREVLDLVALGTIADIVPLTGESRILAKNGIKRLRKQIRPGVRALCENSHINKINSNKISYKLSPHINAAGRLGDPKIAYDLLMTNSIVDAIKLANTLKDYNLQRRAKENSIFREVESQIEEKIKIYENSSILVYGENWHQGIIGNVASRISREYNRPSIVLTIIDGIAYGSGRSAANINLVEILSKSSDILIRYGGHPMAVGLSLDVSNIKELCKRFEKAVKEKLPPESILPTIMFDGDIFISEINSDFFEEMANMEPFGYMNEEPVYRLTNLNVPYYTTAGKFHSRGYLKDINRHSIPFIMFNITPDLLPPSPWDVLATPQINEYNSGRTPQLRLIDVKMSTVD